LTLKSKTPHEQKKGFFICIEGLDGCGKTTQTKLLVNRLEREYAAVYTAEPSQGKIGQFIKEYCLHNETRGSAIVEALLFAADRYEHIQNEVRPALNRRKLVVSDRYIYSSLAYQGAASVDLDWIRMINKDAILPDLAIFIDVDPESVIGRLKPRRSVMENLLTQKKVREFYMRFVRQKELIKIDGNQEVDAVAEDVLKTVMATLKTAS
jgi:dTMP kinase